VTKEDWVEAISEGGLRAILLSKRLLERAPSSVAARVLAGVFDGEREVYTAARYEESLRSQSEFCYWVTPGELAVLQSATHANYITSPAPPGRVYIPWDFRRRAIYDLALITWKMDGAVISGM